MKVLLVFGTRPEAIKLAPVLQEMQRRARDRDIHPVVCVTAQHRDMLDQVLGLFNIRPHYDLGIMTGGQTPIQVASAVLSKLEPILLKEQPDWVVVQGDTTTVAAAAIAAFYARSRVAHVEAGLRTYDKWQPFPEEINRRIAGVVADLHFAPTERARQNLLKEGVQPANIMVTGNPVIDAVVQVSNSPPPAGLDTLIQGSRATLPTGPLLVVTAHRRENHGENMEAICSALRRLASLYQDRVHIVYPVHPNPAVQRTVRRMLNNVHGVSLLPPLDYASLIHLLRRAYLVLTDSGGIQEEAPSLGVPVLVLRNVTERPEAVEAGTVRVIGTDTTRIVREVSRLLESAEEYRTIAHAVNPYGDGRASQRIVSALLGEKVDPFVPCLGPIVTRVAPFPRKQPQLAG